ncbi:MAG: M23 family metallopeptidase [Candidatus Ventricola sp.]
MKKQMTAVLLAAGLLLASCAMAEGSVLLPGTQNGAKLSNVPYFVELNNAQDEPAEADAEQDEAARLAAVEAAGLKLTTKYRWFISQYRHIRTRKVTYYDNVYAYNHGEYYLTPFDSKVSPEYLVVDQTGTYAVAPIVMDITDAMRIRLYGEDVGETCMFYGQYCEKATNGKGHEGFTGIHEGIDFCSEKGSPLYAILDGEVTRAGDSNGTVAIYNEEYDMTVLYLHCYDICVRRGDVLSAGTQIAVEGKKNISGYNTYYTHVEVRQGRHTSSNPYRNVVLESDCPYPLMQMALGVGESGRQAVTAAAQQEALRMREEAEAAARAEAQAQAEAEASQEPEIELVDVLPGAGEGYGFTELTPGESPAPEATLPPN